MDSATPAHPASSANRTPSGTATHSNKFDFYWAQIALVGITICFCNAVVYYPLRLGLSTPSLLVPSCFLIFSAALLAPLLLSRGGMLADDTVRSVAMPLVTLATLATVLAAFVLHGFLLIGYAVVAGAGAWRAWQQLRRASWLQLSFCLVLGCVTGLYLFCTVQSLNYASVYTPEESLLGILNHDTTFHTAIAHIIQNFGVPSTAIDGIIPLKYHFGSHYWFAALGKLASSAPLYSYSAGVPIVLAPMLVVAVLLSAVAIDRARRPLAGYLMLGFGLIFISDLIGWDSYYISESYTCSLIALLLMLPLLALLATETHLSVRRRMIASTVAIAAIALLLVLKISVGTLWTAALSWIILRRFGLGLGGLLTGTAAAVFVPVALALTPSTHDYQTLNGHLIVPFFFFRLFPAAGLACFVLPLVLLFSRTRLYGGVGLRATFREKSDLMLEATMIVLIVGAIPPLLGIPQDSALWYFLNVAQWFAAVLLIARFAAIGERWPDSILTARAFPIVLAAGLASLILLTGAYKQMTSIVIAADEKDNGHLLNGHGALHYFRGALSREHVLWDNQFRDVVANTAGGYLLRTVQRAIPTPDRNTAVFVPPENKTFWTLFSTPRCRDKYNVQVSLTGQPSLLGGPPEAYVCDLDAYTSDYGTHFMSRSISDTNLCKHARERNIKRVLIVAEDRQSVRNRMLDCQPQVHNK